LGAFGVAKSLAISSPIYWLCMKRLDTNLAEQFAHSIAQTQEDRDVVQLSFGIDGNSIFRTAQLGAISHRTCLQVSSESQDLVTQLDLGLDAVFDLAWLKCGQTLSVPTSSKVLTAVDLFCGVGGISFGLQEAVGALGMGLEVVLANDVMASALSTFKENHPTRFLSNVSVEELFDGSFGSELSETEAQVVSQVGAVDILVGGPPCQGHSDLNNHTRRNDPKNELYWKMARAAEVLKPKVVLIENVPGARHDKTGVVLRTEEALSSLGYHLQRISLNAVDFGVAQSRKRFFLLATKSLLPAERIIRLSTSKRPLRWAIEDLLHGYDSGSTFDSSATHSATNQRRIDYLFENQLFELPDSERPDCHRLKPHSYNSVYGRMRWDAPAPTITGGFGSTGQGRFVHPICRRTLTPHEAARVQFFPDHFQFVNDKRRELQQTIGNAVPPKIGYVIGLAVLPLLLID